MSNSIITQDIIANILALHDLSAETLDALHNLGDGDKLPTLIDTDGDEVDDLWHEIADESWEDGASESIYQLAPGVFAHIGDYARHVYSAEDIRDFLTGWDADSYGGTEALLATFGLEPDLDEADEDHVGEVRIWCNYNYYSNHLGSPRDGWASADGRYGFEPLVFETYAEAADWIAEKQESGRGYRSASEPRGYYLLAHGEAAAPDYTICIA